MPYLGLKGNRGGRKTAKKSPNYGEREKKKEKIKVENGLGEKEKFNLGLSHYRKKKKEEEKKEEER